MKVEESKQKDYNHVLILASRIFIDGDDGMLGGFLAP
jgi:hypothetical protein